MKNEQWKEELYGVIDADVQPKPIWDFIESLLTEQKKEMLQELFEESLTAESPIYAIRTGRVIKDFAKSKGIDLYIKNQDNLKLK